MNNATKGPRKNMAGREPTETGESGGAHRSVVDHSSKHCNAYASRVGIESLSTSHSGSWRFPLRCSMRLNPVITANLYAARARNHATSPGSDPKADESRLVQTGLSLLGLP